MPRLLSEALLLPTCSILFSLPDSEHPSYVWQSQCPQPWKPREADDHFPSFLCLGLQAQDLGSASRRSLPGLCPEREGPKQQRLAPPKLPVWSEWQQLCPVSRGNGIQASNVGTWTVPAVASKSGRRVTPFLLLWDRAPGCGATYGGRGRNSSSHGRQCGLNPRLSSG